jgi:hypothetical protein
MLWWALLPELIVGEYSFSPLQWMLKCPRDPRSFNEQDHWIWPPKSHISLRILPYLRSKWHWDPLLVKSVSEMPFEFWRNSLQCFEVSLRMISESLLVAFEVPLSDGIRSKYLWLWVDLEAGQARHSGQMDYHLRFNNTQGEEADHRDPGIPISLRLDLRSNAALFLRCYIETCISWW